MDISRNGSERNHGRTTIISGLPFTSGDEDYYKNNVRWVSGQESIVIKANRVLSIDGKSNHDYTIRITLDDIAALVNIVGHAGAKNNAKSLRDALAKEIPAIAKLLACATGLQPLEISEDVTKGCNERTDTPFVRTAPRKKSVKRQKK